MTANGCVALSARDLVGRLMVDGTGWLLRRVKGMTRQQLLDERHKHRDDGEGWCAAGCKRGVFLLWFPCEVYEAVEAQLARRRDRVAVSA